MKTLKKLISPLFFIFSLIIFAYIFYKSEIVLKGENRSEYLFYFYCTLILIISSIISFFLSPKIKEYLIVIIISFILGLYSFEGYLQFFKKKIVSKNYEKNYNIKFDHRDRIDVYRDLKRIDDNIQIVVPPTNHLLSNYNKIFPVSGISNAKTIYCNENGYYSIFNSDRYGFNNPDEEWDKKEIEYLIVGDSYAMGACVNRPEDIGSVLRNLSGKSVLNLAYGGNGPLIEYVTLREYLVSNVKNIIWVYYEGNDISDLNLELKSEILKKYLNDPSFTQNLRNKQHIIDTSGKNLIAKELKYNFKKKLVSFLKIRKTRFFIMHSKKISKEPKPQLEFKKILQSTKELANEKKANFYFIYLPTFNRYEDKYDGYNYNYFVVKEIVENLNINFIDTLDDVFRKEKIL